MDDWEEEIFERPAEVLRRVKQDAIETAKTELRREYQAERNKERFWSDFYTTHEDLADADLIVRAQASELLQTWGNEPESRAGDFADELAQQSRSYLQRLRETHGAEVPAEPTAAPEPAERPTSIAGLVRARRDARQRARQA